MTEISQEAVERLEPYEHPELGAQMRPCQTLGGYVTFTDYENLVESYEAMKRARTDALRQRDDAQAQVLAGVREQLTMEAAEGLVQAYATGGAEAFDAEVRTLLGEGK